MCCYVAQCLVPQSDKTNCTGSRDPCLEDTLLCRCCNVLPGCEMFCSGYHQSMTIYDNANIFCKGITLFALITRSGHWSPLLSSKGMKVDVREAQGDRGYKSRPGGTFRLLVWNI